jgi:hypothetical protein
MGEKSLTPEETAELKKKGVIVRTASVTEGKIKIKVV